ncbi:MAG: hypothetical protein WBE72_15580 [Terracidiphilus sp.]
MRVKWMQAVFTVIGIAALSGAAAQAQTDTAGQTQTSPAGPAQTSSAGRPRANAGSESEFDIGASFYKAFNHSSSGYGTVQTPKNSAGGMLEVRYIDKPLVGFEFTYAYNPADQTFAPAPPPNCALNYTCNNPATALKAKANEIGLDWVLSKKFGSFRPFAVGGLGFFITSPANSVYNVNTVVRPVYIYGGGVDWAFLSHFGLRFQFRDNLYKAPNLSSFYPSTGIFTHTAEPMGGIFMRF